MIENAKVHDLDEILKLQKLSYVSEAILCDDFNIPPLTQTIESIRKDFDENIILKMVFDGIIIGSIRAFEKDGTCYIGRVIVHPDYQNKGYGKILMQSIEESFSNCIRYELFTGKKSFKNISFYSKLGYKIFKEEIISDKLTFVYFEKIN